MMNVEILSYTRSKIETVRDIRTWEAIREVVTFEGREYPLKDFYRILPEDVELLELGTHTMQLNDGRIIVLSTFVGTVQCLIFHVEVTATDSFSARHRR